jgi:hypothetical protein
MQQPTLLDRLTQPFRAGPLARQVIAEAQTVERNERRDLAEKLRTMELTGVKKHQAAVDAIAIAEAAEAKALTALEAARKRVADLQWERSMVYGEFISPLQAIRNELQRTAPPEIQTAIESCYGEIGTVRRLERLEMIPPADDDIGGKPTVRVVNARAIVAREKALREAVTQLELLRRRYSEDVAADIAAILAEIPSA